jgi:hypothetical protein
VNCSRTGAFVNRGFTVHHIKITLNDHMAYVNYLPPGSAEPAADLRGIPSIFAMSKTGFPVPAPAAESAADGKRAGWSFMQDEGGGPGGGRGGGGGGGGHALASSLSCN